MSRKYRCLECLFLSFRSILLMVQRCLSAVSSMLFRAVALMRCLLEVRFISIVQSVLYLKYSRFFVVHWAYFQGLYEISCTFCTTVNIFFLFCQSRLFFLLVMQDHSFCRSRLECLFEYVLEILIGRMTRIEIALLSSHTTGTSDR